VRSKHGLAVTLIISYRRCPNPLIHESSRPPHLEPGPILILSELTPRGPLPEVLLLGASYPPQKKIYGQAPLHVATNIRGGRSGFIRVSPQDGRSHSTRLHWYASLPRASIFSPLRCWFTVVLVNTFIWVYHVNCPHAGLPRSIEISSPHLTSALTVFQEQAMRLPNLPANAAPATSVTHDDDDESESE
jgi:hypothetical protein